MIFKKMHTKRDLPSAFTLEFIQR